MKLRTTSQKLAAVVEKLARDNPKHAHLFSQERRLNSDGRMLCCIKTCQRPYMAKGLCQPHYHQLHVLKNFRPDVPLGRKGERNGRWKGGQINDGHGRVLVYQPDHPNPSMFGTHVYRYRLVMEKVLGRLLWDNEIVHHKNGNNSDDRPENLEVMTQSKHAKIHNIHGRFSHETTIL